MSDMSSMSRESKKQQLRRGMITSDQQPAPPRGWVKDEPPSGIRHKLLSRRLLLFLLIPALIISAIGAYLYQRFHTYGSYEINWKISLNEGSLVGYESFGNNVLKYTKDGATYMDNKGKAVWTESYEMKSPIAAVNGNYAVIADRQGNHVFICNTEGKVGEAVTLLPITNASVSGLGLVAVTVEDSTSSFIYFFRKDGSSLDLSIRANMAGNMGYPLDISLSKDGTQMMCSFVHLEGGELRERIAFYNFAEVGKNEPTRMVGGFDEMFNNTVVPRVAYMQEPYSCAFGGNGPVFFSSQNLASPEMIAQTSMAEESIESIFYSDEYAGVIVHNNIGEHQNRMEVFRADGSHALSKEFTYDYAQADIDGELIILYNDNSCKIFNMSGVEKFNATFDFSILKIRKGRRPNTLIVMGTQEMMEIKLK